MGIRNDDLITNDHLFAKYDQAAGDNHAYKSALSVGIVAVRIVQPYRCESTKMSMIQVSTKRCFAANGLRLLLQRSTRGEVCWGYHFGISN